MQQPLAHGIHVRSIRRTSRTLHAPSNAAASQLRDSASSGISNHDHFSHLHCAFTAQNTVQRGLGEAYPVGQSALGQTGSFTGALNRRYHFVHCIHPLNHFSEFDSAYHSYLRLSGRIRGNPGNEQVAPPMTQEKNTP